MACSKKKEGEVDYDGPKVWNDGRGVVISCRVRRWRGCGAAGLLYAPQSGTRTRRRIADFAEDVRDKAGDVTEQATEKFQKATEHAAEQFQKATEQATEKFQKAIERGRNLVNG